MGQQTNLKTPEYYEKNSFFRSMWHELRPIKANEFYEINGSAFSIWYIDPINQEENGKGIGPILIHLSNNAFRIIDIQNGSAILTYSQGRPVAFTVSSEIMHEINFVCNAIFHSAINHKSNTIRNFVTPCAYKYENNSKSFEIILNTTTLFFERTKDHDYHILFDNGESYSRKHPTIADGSSGNFQWEKT